MWFRKKALEGDDYVTCAGCGCLMRTAQKEVETGYRSALTAYVDALPYTTAYCGRCAPPYDVKKWRDGKVHYYRKEPSRAVEVTEKGKDVKAKS